MKIVEYPEATTVSNDDYFLLETEGGTKKVKKNKLITETAFEDGVKADGSLAVKASDIYEFVTQKIFEVDNSKVALPFDEDNKGTGLNVSSDKVSDVRIALGQSSAATRQNSIAIGHGAYAGGSVLGDNIAIGWNAMVDSAGYRSIAIGTEARSSHSQSIAIGYYARTTKEKQIAIGYSDTSVKIEASELLLKVNGETIQIANPMSDSDVAEVKAVFSL